jgi:uncharacterized membrane protein YraQ (UPF0718 family)
MGINRKSVSFLEIMFAAVLGAASPICMYGTIPLIATLGKKGLPQQIIAAFMVSSILINPNLFLFSFALGAEVAVIRLFACLMAGIIAGVLVKVFFKNKDLFNYEGFGERKNCSIQKKTFIVYIKDLNRGVIKTAPYFIVGIVLTALFSRYVNSNMVASVFGGNHKLGVILAASLGIPVYVCGGGTIPLLSLWMQQGMSVGSAIAFMISGAATKLTNLSAVKTILGMRNFVTYIAFNIIFAIIAGFIADIIVKLI